MSVVKLPLAVKPKKPVLPSSTAGMLATISLPTLNRVILVSSEMPLNVAPKAEMGELKIVLNPIPLSVTPKTLVVPSISVPKEKGETSILFPKGKDPKPVKLKSVRLTVAPLLKLASEPKELKVSVLKLPAAVINAASSVKVVKVRA